VIKNPHPLAPPQCAAPHLGQKVTGEQSIQTHTNPS